MSEQHGEPQDQLEPSTDDELSEAKAEDRSSFLGRLQSAWRDTVGNYATDEGATRNLFHRLADFGNITGEEARRLITDTQGRIEQNKKELEQRVEESLKRATSHLTPPSADEIDELERKVAEIESRIAALESRG